MEFFEELEFSPCVIEEFENKNVYEVTETTNTEGNQEALESKKILTDIEETKSGGTEAISDFSGGIFVQTIENPLKSLNELDPCWNKYIEKELLSMFNRVKITQLNKERVICKGIIKSNLRILIVRGHLKSIKCALSGITPKSGVGIVKTLGKNQKFDPVHLIAWNTFMSDCIKQVDLLSSQSPELIGINKRNRNGGKTIENECCSMYLNEFAFRKSFILFVNFVFMDKDIESLCKRFKFRCCGDEKHLRCAEKWEQMHRYLITVRNLINDTRYVGKSK